MRSPVTELGVVLPKQWFEGIREVEIYYETNRIVIIPIPPDDPILTLGKYPVQDTVTDASQRHDSYLMHPTL